MTDKNNVIDWEKEERQAWKDFIENQARLKIIKDFLTEYKNQDNRGTCFPIYYTIADYETLFFPDSDGEPFFYDGEEVLDYKEYKATDDITLEEFKKMPEVFYGQKKETIVRKGIFLTESDAEEHLKNNKHHYSAKAHTYVCHAWRAPKLAAFLEALMAFFEIEGGDKK